MFRKALALWLAAGSAACAGSHGMSDAGGAQGCEVTCDTENPVSGKPRVCGLSECGEECLPGCVGGHTCNRHGRCMRTEPSTALDLQQVVSTAIQTCGLTVAGSAVCWPEAERHIPPEAGRYERLAASWGSVCGIKGDGTVDCWEARPEVRAWGDLGVGARDLALGSHGACVDVGDGLWECSDADSGEPPPDDMHFRQVVAGAEHYCGLREDGSVTCWGFSPGGGQVEAPPDAFTMIASGIGSKFTCGILLSDGTARCWATTATVDSATLEVPAGIQFVWIGIALERSCGVGVDGDLRCWGDASDDAIPESGPFVSLALGISHGCALRQDGTVACWGAPEDSLSTVSWE